MHLVYYFLLYDIVGFMTDEKRPRGRPSTGNARTENINLRLSPAELALIEKAAADTPVSTYIRDKAVAAAKRAK
jgi:hypothetical protein